MPHVYDPSCRRRTCTASHRCPGRSARRTAHLPIDEVRELEREVGRAAAERERRDGHVVVREAARADGQVAVREPARAAERDSRCERLRGERSAIASALDRRSMSTNSPCSSSPSAAPSPPPPPLGGGLYRPPPSFETSTLLFFSLGISHAWLLCANAARAPGQEENNNGRETSCAWHAAHVTAPPLPTSPHGATEVHGARA